ncbi:Nrap protein [Crepidotus variabilis]|uniref:U3 small nucleolar RNA-associated protein 22 n=1 Tax=Crepidotus variabilis TaxID=179855 RepID=A0A9P6EML1_9AGAR|nr:Nrap protein [Crepidotus variabilis]
MAQNLKRKRAEISTPRKTARADEDSTANVSILEDTGATEEEREEVDDVEDFDHQKEQDENEAEWTGIAGNAPFFSTLARPEGATPKKAPTGEELRAIKDASDLFKSSSFKLQIDALLPNVRPKPSRAPPLEKFLFSLHASLRDISCVAAIHPLEGSRRLQKKGIAVPYPLPLPSEETNWKVAFEPPTDITLVGSWGNKICIKPKDGLKFGVDVAVEMPDSLFQEKDYMNGRFFHKRAFYLACLATTLHNSKSLNVDVSYESSGGDPRLSKLVLLPKPNSSTEDFSKLNAKVCIIPVLSQQSVIPLHRLSPTHSNLRINAISEVTVEDDVKKASYPATPVYNNALLKCLTPKPYLLTNHTLQSECAAFSDALTLLRVWANQRGFSEGLKTSVHGFESAGPLWASVLGLLLNGEEQSEGSQKSNKRRVVGKGLSSYQLFKAALEFFARHDFEKEVILIRSAHGHRYPTGSYPTGSEGVLVDASSLTNLLAGVPLGSLDLLRCEALKTLELLNQPTFSGDPFTGTFLNDWRDLPTRFDSLLRVNIVNAKPRNSRTHSIIDAGSPATSLISSLASLLREGLATRARAVAILHPSSTARPLSQAHPSNPDIVVIGIIHNPQDAFRLVDHGPAAEEQDETVLMQFRERWGDKAELRRFKDGRIGESVVWEVTTADEKAQIPSMIVRHLLQRHFGLGEDAVFGWESSFDSVLRLPSSISIAHREFGGPAGFKGALTAFDNLVKSMKALDEELPLSLLAVSPISESLRYTKVFSPVPLPTTLSSKLPLNARYVAPIKIVLEFEKSSRWPDDLKAIQSIKLAFYERLAAAITETVENLVARVVIGDGINDSPILSKSFLEIITPEGWAFHAHIWHDREALLLDKIIQGSASRLPHVVQKNAEQKTSEVNEALEAKAVYLRRFIQAPRHHRAIATLCHHYSAFSGTVRLVKRWLSSHWLLDGHVSEEMVELICASLFVTGSKTIKEDIDIEKSSQRQVPGSKERGFAMAVQFLKDWKWEEGLFIPLYGSEAEPEGQTTKLVGSMSVWKLSTEYDREGHVWAYKGPDLLVAHRIKALATATWGLLQGMDYGQLNVQGLFIHPIDDYDFIIQLDISALTRYAHNVNADSDRLAKSKYANKTQADRSLVIMPGFDPAQMLFNDLQRIYADTFKIFYDSLGGDQFGGVWDPILKEPRQFRVLGGFSSIPLKKANEKSKEKEKVMLNQDGIISEIERLGAGLIKKIILLS